MKGCRPVSLHRGYASIAGDGKKLGHACNVARSNGFGPAGSALRATTQRKSEECAQNAIKKKPASLHRGYASTAAGGTNLAHACNVARSNGFGHMDSAPPAMTQHFPRKVAAIVGHRQTTWRKTCAAHATCTPTGMVFLARSMRTCGRNCMAYAYLWPAMKNPRAAHSRLAVDVMRHQSTSKNLACARRATRTSGVAKDPVPNICFAKRAPTVKRRSANAYHPGCAPDVLRTNVRTKNRVQNAYGKQLTRGWAGASAARAGNLFRPRALSISSSVHSTASSTRRRG